MLDVIILIYLIVMAFGLLCYFLQSFGLYQLAKFKGLNYPWMAWIPLISNFLLGDIIDGKIEIAGKTIGNAQVLLFAAPIIGALCFLVPVIGVPIAIVCYVYYCLGLYQLYKLYSTPNAMILFILSLIIPLTIPFFIFSIRQYERVETGMSRSAILKNVIIDEEYADTGDPDQLEIYDELEGNTEAFDSIEAAALGVKSKKARGKISERKIDEDILQEVEIIDEQLAKYEKSNRVKPKKEHRNIFSFKAISSEIHGYGYNYSMADYFKSMLIAFVIMIGAGILLRLNVTAILCLCLGCLVLVPNLAIVQFKYVYEQKRFSDAVSYMENMIYEFKKRPKILMALQATLEVADADLKKRIQTAIDYIHNGQFKENLYREALESIEERYDCERMTSLHKFMIKVEEQGGEYQESINVLLDDIKLWTQRVYEMQTERKGLKGKMTLVIVLALIIFMALTYMVPADFSIVTTMPYQIVTTCAIIALMIFYTLAQVFLTGDWLATDRVSESQTLKDYRMALVGDVKKMRRKMLPLVIVMLAAAIYGLYLRNTILIAAGFGGALVLWTQPKQKMKAIQRRSLREINKQFPTWLRDLALTLQKENVQVAINNSLPEAPVSLVVPLTKLVKDLDQDPTTIKPYNNFLKAFDLPDISSAMKMLYAMNEAGRDEAVKQINTLVERNNKLLEKAERLRNEDVVALSGFMVAIPMVIIFVKTVIDLGLILMSFMEKMG